MTQFGSATLIGVVAGPSFGGRTTGSLPMGPFVAPPDPGMTGQLRAQEYYYWKNHYDRQRQAQQVGALREDSYNYWTQYHKWKREGKL